VKKTQIQPFNNIVYTVDILFFIRSFIAWGWLRYRAETCSGRWGRSEM